VKPLFYLWKCNEDTISIFWAYRPHLTRSRLKTTVPRLLKSFYTEKLLKRAPSPHNERVPGSTPGWGLSVWSLHVLPVYAWVLSRYSSFLPPSKNMHVRLFGDSKIVLKGRVSVCVVVCLVCLCVALWWTGDLSRVYPASRLMTAGIGSRPPATWPMD